MIIFAFAGIVGLVLTLCLPETKGKEMKDTLEDMVKKKTPPAASTGE